MTVTEFVDLSEEAYDKWTVDNTFVIVEKHSSYSPAEYASIAVDDLYDQPSSPDMVYVSDESALIAALDEGDWPTVSALVLRPGFTGINAKCADGSTALHCATFFSQADVFAAVLSRPDFLEINAVNECGSTALHNAAYRGFGGMCSAIMARTDFVKINARNNCGYTALHSAAARNLADVCSAIVAHPEFTAVSAKNIYGATALQMAQRYGHHDVVAVLTR
jgi:hypothetical protein